MEDWNHIRDEIRTAIKPHFCKLCDYRIQPGEKYLRRVGTQDGEISATPLHIACEVHTKHWDKCDWIFNDSLEFRKNELGGKVLERQRIPRLGNSAFDEE